MKIQFQKQTIMRHVVLALLPAGIGSVYFFGWVTAAMVLLSMSTCIVVEWLFVRRTTGKVSEAVLVTGMLLGLILPPTLPLWMVVAGAAFAITFGKMAFGGFGANIFNPAMVGRAFLYITFPVYMTNRWIPAADFSQFPGGFIAWRFMPAGDLAAITAATASHAGMAAMSSAPGLLKLFLGNINGQYEALGEMIRIGGGSAGETSALLLILGGVYLLIKRIANWRLVTGFFVMYVSFQAILFLVAPESVLPPLYAFLSGGAVLGGFFMVTDPVSAPKTKTAQFLYAMLIAVFTVLIRSFSLFAGGLMFSILLGNMFASILDVAVRGRQKGTAK